MDKFVVTGEVQLRGEVRIGGAKNAALPVMAAALLSGGESVIRDVPDLRDIRVMQEILAALGASVTRRGAALIIDTRPVNRLEIPDMLMREMRASVFLMGPLMGRFRKVRLSYPGGCAIGPRPIDLHTKALEKLGAVVREQHGFIEAEAARLKGAEILFDFPSVGATENAMMAAVLAEGTTIIRNAAREPEVVDLQSFLNQMGARVAGAGTDTIRIDGVARLQAAEHVVMPDRIQAGTILIAGAITGGTVTATNISPEYLFAVIDKLQEIGVTVTAGGDFVTVRPGALCGADVKTLPFPGFPTDLQAPLLALLTIARGSSIVTETIFENRFKHVDELVRMGAKIKVEGRTAVVRGASKLTGAKLEALDLRAGGALTLAALAASGVSEIKSVHHIDRGYERLEEQLGRLGAQIRRVAR